MGKLRYGIISGVDSTTGLYRVNFDNDEIVSAWLPQIVRNSKNNKDYDPFDINEQVVCLMDENNENGVILGAIYSSADKPSSEAAAKVWSRKFADGTVIKYDQNLNKYTVSLGSGSMELTGDLKVTGKISATGNIESGGDVKTATVSLNTHVHIGVQPGSGLSGTPKPM